MSRIIALTGGIASGKSTVAAYLRDEKGAALVDADALVRRLQAVGQPGWAAIHGEFGEDYFLPDGTLDRKKLGARIFSDDAARKTLNDIMHPLVYTAMDEITRDLEKAGVPLIVLEIPLLFETGMQDRFEEIWLVAASEPVQMARLMARDGLSEVQAHARIASQMPLEQKVALAHAVIMTDQGMEGAKPQIDAQLSR